MGLALISPHNLEIAMCNLEQFIIQAQMGRDIPHVLCETGKKKKEENISGEDSRNQEKFLLKEALS